MCHLAVSEITGVPLASSQVSISAGFSGSHSSSIVWQISFPPSQTRPDPIFITAGTGLSSEARVSSSFTSLFTPTIVGTFNVSYGSSCGFITINSADTSVAIKAKLALLPGIPAPPKTITVSGSNSSSILIGVTFDVFTAPGTVSLLTVSDSTQLVGRVSTRKAIDGSTDCYALLPTELTSVATFNDKSFNVLVNQV